MESQNKNMKTKLKQIIDQYFEEHDDYYEAKDAFIEEVNDILTSRNAEDQGVICKNLVSDQIIELKSVL